jgi:hypothetical protein
LRRKPSLRTIADALTAAGHFNERGKPFAPKSIAAMLTTCERPRRGPRYRFAPDAAQPCRPRFFMDGKGAPNGLNCRTVVRLRQGQEVDGPSQLGRRLDRVSFDRHSQHRSSVRGVAGDPAHDPDASVHQILPRPGFHAKPSQGAGRQEEVTFCSRTAAPFSWTTNSSRCLIRSQFMRLLRS